MASSVVPITTSVQVQLIAVPAAFSLLAATAVTLRFTARRIANRRPEASDWVMFASVVVMFALSGTVIAQGVVGGAGWHATDLVAQFGPGKLVTFLKIAIPVQILWAVSLSLCKISILLLCAKVFEVRAFRIPAGITGVIILLWMLATVLSSLLICIINIITDLAVILLPIPHLLRLEMALYKKVTIICTFAAGLFTCVASAVRLKSIVEINFNDVTATSAEAYVWSTVEPGLAITLACVPLLRPFLGRKYSPTGTALKATFRSRAGWERTHHTPHDETSSEYQLRPVGPKNDTKITSGISSTSQSNSLYAEDGDGAVHPSIGVRKEWEVTSSHKV